MRIFDPHIHMTSRTTDDYEAMAAAGIELIVEPAFWLGQPRTNIGSFIDYFDGLIGWERFRAEQFGVSHHCTMGLNPKEANDEALAREVLALLPRYLAKDRVVAIGEIGFDSMTRAEEYAFQAQMELAVEHDLPALVHTPHRDKAYGTQRSIEIALASGISPDRVIIDHNNELTFQYVRDAGCWAGFTIYPETKMDEHRLVRIVAEHGMEKTIVNSAADWGRSDPLKVPRTVQALREADFSDADISTLVWDNPVAFFSQSGRLELTDEHGPADPSATFAGNSVLRGAREEG